MSIRSHAVVGLAVAVAVGGGGYAAKRLTEGSASTAGAGQVLAAQQNASQPVPFLGPFAADKKHGTVCGPAVRLMEGALRNTTPPIRKAKAANCVGAATTRQIRELQRRHQIPASGIYGERTHEALAHAYTKEQRLDLTYLARARVAAIRRQTILIVTSHAYAQRDLMHYCGAGAYNGHLSDCFLRGQWPAWPDVPRHTDCSGYVSWVLFQSGVPNPNGIGVGTTKTLVLHGTPVGLNGPLKVGDLVFYAANNSHVAIYIGHGLVSSHGKPGLDIHPYGYRPIYAIRRYF